MPAGALADSAGTDPASFRVTASSLSWAMAETTKLRKVADGLITIGAVWLALTLAGIPTLIPVEISPVAMATMTLVLYSLLLAGYAFGFGPGQRSRFPAFAIGGFLYPAYFVVLLIELERFRSSERFSEALMSLGAGIAVGFQVRGGPDAPVEFYLLPWLANFLIPIVIVLAGRAMLRERAERRSLG